MRIPVYSFEKDAREEALAKIHRAEIEGLKVDDVKLRKYLVTEVILTRTGAIIMVEAHSPLAVKNGVVYYDDNFWNDEEALDYTEHAMRIADKVLERGNNCDVRLSRVERKPGKPPKFIWTE